MSYDYARIIGNNINNQLNNQGIQLDEFASYMGYNFTEVMQLFEGRLAISIHEMNKIADYLGIDVMDLGKNKIR